MPPTCVSAAAPGLPDESTLSRRSLLTAVPAAGSTMMLKFSAGAQEDTEILQLFREWRTYFEWAESPATDGMVEEDFNQVCAGRCEIEERMFALPCTCPADVLAKLLALTLDGQDLVDDGGTRSKPILREAVAAGDGALTGRGST